MSPDSPLARSQGLTTEELDGDLLVFDSTTNLAHSLDAAAAAIWRACDGHTCLHALAVRCHADEESVRTTLAALAGLGLLETPEVVAGGDTRRAVLRKITVAGAGLASHPRSARSTCSQQARQVPALPNGTCVSSENECCSGQGLPMGPGESGSVCQTPGFLCCPPPGACAVQGGFGVPVCCKPGLSFVPDPTCSLAFRCV